MNYNIGEPVPFFTFVLDSKGVGISGDTIALMVKDTATGENLLAPVQIPESVFEPGYYSYSWANSVIARKSLVGILYRFDGPINNPKTIEVIGYKEFMIDKSLYTTLDETDDFDGYAT